MTTTCPHCRHAGITEPRTYADPMTAPATTTGDLRVRLAGALTAWADLDPELAGECADVLLPFVETYARTRAATALRDVQSLLWPGRETHIRQDELRRALRGEP